MGGTQPAQSWLVREGYLEEVSSTLRPGERVEINQVKGASVSVQQHVQRAGVLRKGEVQCA